MSLSHTPVHVADSHMVVSVRLFDQLLGIPVKYVRDVLPPQPITPIPLAPFDILGSLNLRGRIVTVVDLRRRLGLPARQSGQKTALIVVDIKSELYGLQVDAVGEVLPAPPAVVDKPPANLDEHWKTFATGMVKLEQELLVLIDAQKLLSP